MAFPWLSWAVFLFTQVGVIVLFKYGGTAPSRFFPCFIIANAFGVPSTLLLMRIYTKAQANVALALTMGATFMLSQVALWLIFRESMSSFQRFGIVVVCVGVACLCWKGA